MLGAVVFRQAAVFLSHDPSQQDESWVGFPTCLGGGGCGDDTRSVA